MHSPQEQCEPDAREQRPLMIPFAYNNQLSSTLEYPVSASDNVVRVPHLIL
jgi:hypothetical protein